VAVETISITVRLFASLRESVGSERVSLALPQSTPVGAVWGHLPAILDEHPPHGLRYALNHEWTSPAATLRDGDEVALILPVSGG
jgi:molybdopterin converting factor small subunit